MDKEEIHSKQPTKMFEDTLVSSKFNIYRNAVRDYYVFGFKTYKNVSQGAERQRYKHWMIIKKAFSDYWDIISDQDGCRVIQLNTEERNSGENPFHEMYFHHLISSFADYLGILLALDEKSIFCLGRNAVKGTIFDSVDDLRNETADKLLDYLEKLPGWSSIRNPNQIEVRRKEMVNQEISAILPELKEKKVEHRMDFLTSLGIVRNLKYDKNTKENSGNRKQNFWTNSELTMENMLDCAQKGCERQIPPQQFLQRIYDMLSFFSQYYPLGEIGTILKKRMKMVMVQPKPDVFRFKHNYLQKSIMDYTLLDLLEAIENQCYCLIQYVRGEDGRISEFCIVPLEIRVNAANGREYVLYYDVLYNCVGSLRMEFIESVTIYESVSRIDFYNIYLDGAKKKEKSLNKPVIINDARIKSQIKTARQMMNYVFGAELGSYQVEKDWEKECREYKFTVKYDINNEKYIASRIQASNRNCESIDKIQDTILVKCFPTKEFRPWIRSFCGRIINMTECDRAEFVEDIQKMSELCWTSSLEKKKENKKEPQISYRHYKITGKKQIRIPHESLFNEMFSNYAILTANALLRYNPYGGEDLNQIVRELVTKQLGRKSKLDCDAIVSSIMRQLEKAGLYYPGKNGSGRGGTVRFMSRKNDYLYELLPLFDIERRWLLAVFEDPLAKVFLPEEILDRLKDFVSDKDNQNYSVQAFRWDHVKCFNMRSPKTDKYGYTRCVSELIPSRNDSVKWLTTAYESIRKQEKISIHYRNGKGEERYRLSRPAWIEYSFMDRTFRICDSFKISGEFRNGKINVPRIFKMTPKSEKYQLEEEQKRYMSTYVNLKVIMIQFYEGDKNLPDRILTEFSQWKKECLYEEAEKKFTMTLHYPEEDEKDILIRLLGYGPYILVTSDDNKNYICDQINERVSNQMTLNDRWLIKENNLPEHEEKEI